MVDRTDTHSHTHRNTERRPCVRRIDDPRGDGLTTGQVRLLERIPTAGDVIDLSDAVRVVDVGEQYAYGSIVALMNRGFVSADFIEAPSVDPEIVLRRL